MYKVMVSEMPHEKTAYKTFDHQNDKKNCSSGKILPKKLFFFDIESHWHFFSRVSCVII